jgi:general nucleoside transport system permease protein
VSEMLDLFDAPLLHSTIRSVTPILLAALGGLICERAGVFNIGLEGLLLTGAFASVAGSFYAGSALGGVMVAVLAGMVLAGLFAVLAVSLRGNVIVIGIAINLLAAGGTVYLLRELFDVRGVFQDPQLQGLADIDLPLLGDIPVVSEALSGHSALVYLSWLLVAAAQVFLFRSALGLRLRGVGERPEAAETLGVRVAPVRYGALLAAGALCGLAGAQLALGNVTLFAENMSAGRGWIAVVAVMLGQAHPLGVLGASLLFGFADTLGFRLQGLGLPQQATGAIPYLLTLLALFLAQARRRAPARSA